MIRKILFNVFIIFSFVAMTAFADERSNNDKLYCTYLSQQQVANTDNVSIAKRGCCSHHGGVCSCRSGRTVCCDGSYSPSCTCFKHTSENKPS